MRVREGGGRQAITFTAIFGTTSPSWWSWDLGNGQHRPNVNPLSDYVYGVNGDYPARIGVTDACGIHRVSNPMTITVTEGGGGGGGRTTPAF